MFVRRKKRVLESAAKCKVTVDSYVPLRAVWRIVQSSIGSHRKMAFVVTSLLTLHGHTSVDERSSCSDHGVATSLCDRAG